MTLLLIIAAASAMACALYLAPSVFRWFAGQGDRIDLLACPACFVALVAGLFNVRWLIWPDAVAVMNPSEFAVWTGLRTLSIIGWLVTIHAFRQVRRV